MSPFLGFWVVQRKADDALAQMVHGVDPKQIIDLVICKSEKRVDFFKCL